MERNARSRPFERARQVTRAKIVRAVQAGVQGPLLNHEHALLRRLDELEGRLASLDHRIQRDIDFVGQVDSALAASRFAMEYMHYANRLPTSYDTLRYAISLAPPEGMILEFGVAAGNTLRILAEHRGERELYGFDSFEGLPEDWRTGFPKGFFKMEPPEVEGAELVIGTFEATLPGFAQAHDGPVAFIHADGDMYSSTKTILDNLEDRLVPGVIIQFDEFFNYPGWEHHEYRAWKEFVDRTGIDFEYAAYSAADEQVVVRIL